MSTQTAERNKSVKAAERRKNIARGVTPGQASIKDKAPLGAESIMEQLPKIVQRGLRTTAKPGVHPDPDLLTAFAEKSLNDRERSQVLQHLGECADCRDVISLATPEIVRPLPAIPERSRWLSWPTLRWGALAACVIVVSAAVTLREWQTKEQPLNSRQQSSESSAAEKATPAQENPASASNAPKPPADELTAKSAPPARFQSDHDSGTSVGNLAKQSNQTNADAAKSVNKISGPVAPPPASLPTDRTVQAEPQSATQNVRNEIGSTTETVTVQSEAAPVLTNPAEKKSKDESNQNESHKEVQSARAAVAGAMVMRDRKADAAAPDKTPPSATPEYTKQSQASSAPSWTISANGNLQRSIDSGKTWQTIPVADNTFFRALAVNNSDVWVGGAAGALYHSSDAGQHWTQVKPAVNGRLLTADIITIEFDDTQHGKVTTANREAWTTSDAGSSWQSH